MQLKFISVLVKDQEAALKFYTEKLGFVKMSDISLGEYRWLTVVSPDGIAGVELLLEPMGFPPAQVYQKALFDAGVPMTAMVSRDIKAEVQRLKALGVVFRGEPQEAGWGANVMFEDGCGNLINLVQLKG